MSTYKYKYTHIVLTKYSFLLSSRKDGREDEGQRHTGYTLPFPSIPNTY